MLKFQRVWSVHGGHDANEPRPGEQQQSAAGGADSGSEDSFVSVGSIGSAGLSTTDMNSAGAAAAAAWPSDARVVGQERDGTILVSREINVDTRRKTVIELWDGRAATGTVLYEHQAVTRVVGASINAERTLLAISTSRPRLSEETMVSSLAAEGGPSDVGASHEIRKTELDFESFLSEINPQANCYSLNVVSSAFQRVQFCPCEKSIARAKTSHFIFMLDNQFIHLYQISVRKRADSEGFQIFAQPMLQAQLVKQFLWYQWDMHTSLLHVLMHKARGSVLVPVLRTFSLAERKPDSAGEIQIELALSRDVEPLACFAYAPSGTGLSSLPLQCPSYSLVHMPDGGRCFVQQMFRPASQSTGASITVVVHVLHSNDVVEFSIPLNTYSSPSEGSAADTSAEPSLAQASSAPGTGHAAATGSSGGAANLAPPGGATGQDVELPRQASVSCFCNMLLVLIPGYYLHLVDCCVEHELMRSIVLCGASVVGSLPSAHGTPVRGQVAPLLVPLSALPGAPLLDMNTGTAYKLNVDHDAILAFLSVERVSVHVRIMHFVCTHLMQPGLANDMIRHLCATHPSRLSVPLMREFLVALPLATQRSDRGADFALGAMLPTTCMHPLRHEHDAPPPPFSLESLVVRDGPVACAGQLAGVASPSPVRVRLDRDVATSLSPTGTPRRRESSGHATQQPSAVKRLLLRLFNMDDRERGGGSEDERRRASPASSRSGTPGPGTPGSPYAAAGRESGKGSALQPASAASAAGAAAATGSFSPGAASSPNRGSGAFDEADSHGDADFMLGDGPLNWSSEEHSTFIREQITRMSPRLGKSRITRILTEFHGAIAERTALAYELVLGQAASHAPPTQFFLHETLFCALDELQLPPPRSFHYRFALLGFQTLARPAFLMYLDSGVFRLTARFVSEACAALGDTREDRNLRYRIASGLLDRQRIEMLLAGEPEYQHAKASSLVLLPPPSDKSGLLTQRDVGDDFWPLDLYVRRLQEIEGKASAKDIAFLLDYLHERKRIYRDRAS